jgi:hypothetical protein
MLQLIDWRQSEHRGRGLLQDGQAAVFCLPGERQRRKNSTRSKKEKKREKRERIIPVCTFAFLEDTFDVAEVISTRGVISPRARGWLQKLQRAKTCERTSVRRDFLETGKISTDLRGRFAIGILASACDVQQRPFVPHLPAVQEVLIRIAPEQGH